MRRAERLAQAAAAKSEAAKVRRQQGDCGRGHREQAASPAASVTPIATHTGESLARAAQLAVAAKPTCSRPSRPRPVPISRTPPGPR